MARIMEVTRLSNNAGESQIAGVATFFVSDWRYGAVVEQEATAYRNEYNRPEAIKRLQRFIRRANAITTQAASSHQFDGCIVALGGGMVDESACEDLEAQRQLRAEAVDAILTELIELRDLYGEVFVPCLAVCQSKFQTRGNKTIQTFDTSSGDVAFYYELAQKAAPFDGIEIDFQANKVRQFWNVYDTPVVMVNAAATFRSNPDTVSDTIRAGVFHRDVLLDSLRPYRGEQQLEKMMLLFSQSGFSISALEQGIIGNASMVGAESVEKDSVESRPSWHCWITKPGVGTAAVHRVYGVPVLREDIELALTLPAISRWTEGQDKVAQESNITVVNFG